MKASKLVTSIPKKDKGPENSAPAVVVAAAGPYMNFSRKDRLVRAGGKLFGNWQSSFSGACVYPFSNIYIEEGAIITLEEVGKCSDNAIIVKATHN